MRKFPIVLWALAIYAALMVTGLLFEPVLLLWPHLFLLATEPWFGPPTEQLTLVAMVVAAIPVSALAAAVQLAFGPVRPGSGQAALLGGVLTLGLLAILTLVVFIPAYFK